MYQPKAHYRAWEKEYSKKGNLWRYESGPEVPSYLGSGRILEVGCGNGKTLRALAGKGYEITAIDVSKKALELAQEAVGGDPKITFEQGDVCSMRFEQGCFDGVVCSFVLQHLLLEERKKAALELRRVLKPGGFLFVDVFSEEDMRCGKGVEVEPGTFKRGTGIITHYFAEGELLQLLGGFSVESFRTIREAKVYAGREYARASFRVVCKKPDAND